MLPVMQAVTASNEGVYQPTGDNSYERRYSGRQVEAGQRAGAQLVGQADRRRRQSLDREARAVGRRAPGALRLDPRPGERGNPAPAWRDGYAEDDHHDDHHHAALTIGWTKVRLPAQLERGACRPGSSASVLHSIERTTDCSFGSETVCLTRSTQGPKPKPWSPRTGRPAS